MSTKDRANCWSVTINNPTSADEEYINLARQTGWRVEGQLETGENGTPHYQLVVRTPQVRFSAVKKAFPRAHIEVARSPAALSKYVVKEETRSGELPVQQNRYPSLSKYWEMVAQRLDAMNWIDWNYVHNPKYERPDHVWWKEAPKRCRGDPLYALDEVTGDLIEAGYFVEGICANPSTRWCWKHFHARIIIRALADIDRQTDDRVQIQEQEVETIDIPTTDANDYSRS